MVWFYTMVSVILVSAISLVGVLFLSANPNRLRKVLLLLVSFAVGALTGDAFIHLLPEAFEKLGHSLTTSLYVLTGMLLFFLMEKFVRWRHHHHIAIAEMRLHPVVALNLIGDAAHNFIDGILIGASYTVSIPIGITTTIAAILHEIPQELGDFGILVHGGLPARLAVLFNFSSALTAILGAIISLSLGHYIQDYSYMMMPITAGGFIYIASADLIPELLQERRLLNSLLQILAVLLGIGVMAFLVLLE